MTKITLYECAGGKMNIEKSQVINVTTIVDKQSQVNGKNTEERITKHYCRTCAINMQIT